MTNRRQRRMGMRIAHHSETQPTPAHNSWRLNSRQGEFPLWNWLIEVADSTITRPSMVSTVMTTAIT